MSVELVSRNLWQHARDSQRFLPTPSLPHDMNIDSPQKDAPQASRDFTLPHSQQTPEVISREVTPSRPTIFQSNSYTSPLTQAQRLPSETSQDSRPMDSQESSE